VVEMESGTKGDPSSGIWCFSVRSASASARAFVVTREIVDFVELLGLGIRQGDRLPFSTGCPCGSSPESHRKRFLAYGEFKKACHLHGLYGDLRLLFNGLDFDGDGHVSYEDFRFLERSHGEGSRGRGGRLTNHGQVALRSRTCAFRGRAARNTVSSTAGSAQSPVVHEATNTQRVAGETWPRLPRSSTMLLSRVTSTILPLAYRL
jgi:hypothetical protein